MSVFLSSCSWIHRLCNDVTTPKVSTEFQVSINNKFFSYQKLHLETLI